VMGVAAVSLLPTEPHAQYLVIAVPFMAELAARGLSIFLDQQGRRNLGICALVGSVYLLCGLLEAARFTISGEGVPGILRSENAPAWRIETASKVATELSALAPHGPVVASWSGYLVGSRATAWTGTENFFGRLAGDHTRSRTERMTRHTLSHADLTELATSGKAPVWVLGVATWPEDGTSLALQDAGYQPVAFYPSAVIVVAPRNHTAP